MRITLDFFCLLGTEADRFKPGSDLQPAPPQSAVSAVRIGSLHSLARPSCRVPPADQAANGPRRGPMRVRIITFLSVMSLRSAAALAQSSAIDLRPLSAALARQHLQDLAAVRERYGMTIVSERCLIKEPAGVVRSARTTRRRTFPLSCPALRSRRSCHPTGASQPCTPFVAITPQVGVKSTNAVSNSARVSGASQMSSIGSTRRAATDPKSACP